jgi:hypothetical protein
MEVEIKCTAAKALFQATEPRKLNTYSGLRMNQPRGKDLMEVAINTDKASSPCL